MLSRVLDPNAVEVEPVAWRISTPAARARRPLPAAHGGEAAVLGARIQELTEASERQAQQAYEAGHRAGEVTGRAVSQEAVRQAVEKLSEAVGEVAGARADVLRRAEADVVKLSIEIARRVIDEDLRGSPKANRNLRREIRGWGARRLATMSPTQSSPPRRT